MPDHPSEAAITAWVRLVKASRHVLGAVEADLRTAGFPPLGWYDVLLELRRAGGPLRPLAIEGRLLIAQHNVSRLIDRLETAGYVERQPCDEDGRGQVVVLTDAGQALLKRMWPVYRSAIQRHVAAKLTDDGASRLSQLLGRLLEP